jgi:hypothetical protein
MRLLEIEIDKIQAEADSFANAPPNIVRTVWDRFVEFRKRRSELEREVSQKYFFLFHRYKASCILAENYKLGTKTTENERSSFKILSVNR